MKIVVAMVDDEVDTDKEQIKIEWLEQHGVDILPFKHVKDVLPFLEGGSRKLDLLLLDILIPPLTYYSLEETNQGTDTGLRLLRDIRKFSPKLPVVIMSVKPPVELGGSIEELGVDGYLYKPVLGVDILEEIERVLGTTGRSR